MYGCYFAANSDTSRVDAVFNSMHFERITVSDEYIGTPQVACETLKEELEETQKAIDQLEEDTRSLMESHASELMGARKRLEELSNNFDVRKMAARIEDDNKEDYYICIYFLIPENILTLPIPIHLSYFLF